MPLVVDLDGTLVRTDTLFELLFHLLRTNPRALLRLPGWLARGKAFTKNRLASGATPDAALLPYHGEFLDYLRAERARGRALWLATGADGAIARAVTKHLGIFEGSLASDGEVNLTGERKLTALRQLFPQGFDYAGNAPDDLVLWEAARGAILVGAAASVARRARRRGSVVREFNRKGRGRFLARAMRLHQWSKNLLLFLPVLGAHHFRDWQAWSRTLLAFFAFGLVASSVYVINDLLDLDSDRRHARKKSRPFAAGLLPLEGGVALAAFLLTSGAALSLLLPPLFRLTLAAYFVATLAYSLSLKRRTVLDVFVLAGLYTVRIYAGSFASGIVVSEWLATFAIFFFISLAFVKRASELVSTTTSEALPGRGYVAADLAALCAMGVSSGFVSTLVLSLYFASHDVLRLYAHPERLWFLPVLTLYWLAKLWMAAGRGEIDGDPIVFAARFRTSYLVAALALLVTWAGI